MDYYALLGASRADSQKEIKEKYQKLLLIHHPDKNGGKESQQIKDILQAWQVLGDECRRREHDAELHLHEYDSDLQVWKDVRLEELGRGTSSATAGCCLEVECRCGGAFQVDEGDLPLSARGDQQGGEEVLIGCDTCSLVIRIIR